MLIACAVARAGSTPAQAHDRCVRARCGGGVWGWGMCVSISNVFYVAFSCGVWLLARAFLCAPESGAKSCPIARAPLGGSKKTLGWWGWGVWGSQRGPRCVPSYDLASRLVCSIRAECRRRASVLATTPRRPFPKSTSQARISSRARPGCQARELLQRPAQDCASPRVRQPAPFTKRDKQ